MARNRVHHSDAKPDPLFLTTCGRMEATATTRIELVSCRACLKRLNKQEVPIIRELVQTLSQEAAALSSLLDPETGLPVLTPETYLRRDCTCGSCAVCKHVKAIEDWQEVAPWTDRPQLQRQRGWRWPSVNAALTWYADSMDDGFPQKSLGAALERLARAGTMISGGAATDPKAISDADDRATVETALRAAATEEPDVQSDMALMVLFCAAVGTRSRDKRGRIVRTPATNEALAADTGLSAKAVGNLVKRLKRRLKTAFKASGSMEA